VPKQVLAKDAETNPMKIHAILQYKLPRDPEALKKV